MQICWCVDPVDKWKQSKVIRMRLSDFISHGCKSGRFTETEPYSWIVLVTSREASALEILSGSQREDQREGMKRMLRPKDCASCERRNFPG
jgi:hypothetical protein